MTETADPGDGRRRPPDVARRGRARPAGGRASTWWRSPRPGNEALARFPAAPPAGGGARPADPGPERRRGHRRGAPARPRGPGADPLRLRRAGRRPRGGQGRRDRLPREVGVPRRAARRRAPGGRGRHGVHARAWPGWCWGSSGGCRTPRQSADPTRPELTERETEVLKMVAKGMSYKQIAERLVLSHRTVQNHVQNTLRKLQMHNRVELTRYAIEQGLDDDPDDDRRVSALAPYLGRLGVAERPAGDPRDAGRPAPAAPRRGALREPRHHARPAAGRRPRCVAGPGRRDRPRGLLLPPERRDGGGAARARLRRVAPARARVDRRRAPRPAPTSTTWSSSSTGCRRTTTRAAGGGRTSGSARARRTRCRWSPAGTGTATSRSGSRTVDEVGLVLPSPRVRLLPRDRGARPAHRRGRGAGRAHHAVDAARRARSPGCWSCSAAIGDHVDTLRCCVLSRFGPDGRTQTDVTTYDDWRAALTDARGAAARRRAGGRAAGAVVERMRAAHEEWDAAGRP